VAKYGSDDVIINIGPSSGGSASVDLSDFVETINGFSIEAMLQEVHAFGDSWVEQMFTGLKRVNDITLGGFYDDAANSPVSVFGDVADVGSSGRFRMDVGSSNIVEVDYVVRSFQATPTRGELTRYEAVLVPSGAVTTAT